MFDGVPNVRPNALLKTFQLIFTCLKFSTETLEKDAKHIPS